MRRLSFLIVLVLLPGIYPMSTSHANSLKTTHPIAVRLVDDHGGLITNVKLTVRQAGSDRVRSDGKAGQDGLIPMSLSPGRYYFTGDVSILNLSGSGSDWQGAQELGKAPKLWQENDGKSRMQLTWRERCKLTFDLYPSGYWYAMANKPCFIADSQT